MLDILYLAGFFDGEGTIIIQRQLEQRRTAPRRPGNTSSYQLAVGVSSTYRPILLEFQERFGGHIGTQKASALQTKPAHYWRATGAPARTALTELAPHLIEKRSQALLALQMPAQRVGGKYRTLEEKALQEQIYQEVKRLKHTAS